MRLTRRFCVPAVVLALVASACSSGGDADLGQGGGGGGGGNNDAPTTTAPRFFPLTGLPVTDPAKLNRSAVTVKIENSRQSRPQGGLDNADVIFEAVVEGGQTRFLVIFHSNDSDNAGPVRSVRPSDPAVVAPFGGIVAYSGGIKRFVDAMEATGLKNFHEDRNEGTLRRRSDKAAPHNLFTSTVTLREKAGAGTPPPKFAQFLAPDQPFAPAGATPVTHIDLPIGRTTAIAWDWDAGQKAWLRKTDGVAHGAEGGGQLSPTTVILQFVTYEPTGEVDTTGAPVDEAKVVGTGDAVVFANGVMVRARWSKPNATSMTTWTDAAGAPLLLPPGQTWVELPVAGTPFNAT